MWTADGLEKFRDWTDRFGILHHTNFYDYLPVETFGSQTANFKTTGSAVLKVQVDEFDVPGAIEFKDPWLRDSSENPYGKLNRGENAIYRSQTSPFNPNTSSSGAGSEYKGVLLNQSPLLVDLYYSARVLLSQSISNMPSFLMDWSYNSDHLGLNLIENNPPGPAHSSMGWIGCCKWGVFLYIAVGTLYYGKTNDLLK